MNVGVDSDGAAGEPVDCHDGEHLQRDSHHQERVDETGGDIIQYITEIATIKNEWMRQVGHYTVYCITEIATIKNE